MSPIVIVSTFSQDMSNAWDAVAAFLTGAGWTVVAALAAAVLGIIVVRIALGILRKVLLKSPMDSTLANFILTVTRFVLWLLLFFIIAGIMQIPLTPLITALGAVALAIGLALKDSLANLANGVMLIGIKPFKEGQYVDIDGVSGTVKSIGLLTTELITPDNKKVVLPNTKITTASITNYSAKPTRRVDWEFSASYDSDVDFVKSVVMKELLSHEKILSSPEPMVRMTRQEDSAIVFTARAWVNNADYWDVNWDIGESVFKRFAEEGISIPYPQLDVHFDRADKAGGNLPDVVKSLAENKNDDKENKE